MTSEHHLPRTARVVHNLIILDESGSMEEIKSSTISGYNELVQSIRSIKKRFPEQDHRVSLYTFNGLGITRKLFAENVSMLKKFSEDDFNPDAMTPLYDAIGQSVNELRRRMKSERDSTAQVTIFTDGEENDSTEYNRRAIRSLVENMQNRGWTFSYIGTNHDVHAAADAIGIDETQVLKCVASREDIKAAFASHSRQKMELAESMQREDSEDRSNG